MIKLLRFMKPYRRALILVVLLAVAQTLGNLYLPNLFADIVNNGIVKGDTGYIWRFGKKPGNLCVTSRRYEGTAIRA